MDLQNPLIYLRYANVQYRKVIGTSRFNANRRLRDRCFNGEAGRCSPDVPQYKTNCG